MLTLHPAPAAAQSELIDREYELKAAYLYNFGKYVTWPADADIAISRTAFLIGVVGEDPFGGVLDNLARIKRLNERPIVLHRIRTAAEFRPCHVMFFPAEAPDHLKDEIFRRSQSLPVVTVGESAGFAAAGGVLNFYVSENRIRFEINQSAARRARVQVSSRLLRLGRIVEEPGESREGRRP